MNHRVQRTTRRHAWKTRRSLSMGRTAWNCLTDRLVTSCRASDALASASTSARHTGDGLSTAPRGTWAGGKVLRSLHLANSLEHISTPAALAFLLLPNLKYL
jgi:hypothetical protein